MTYYQLLPKDSPHDNWLFHIENQAGKLVSRPEYDSMRCRRCAKLDEFAALATFVPPDLTIRGHWDFLGLSDDFGIAVNHRFIDLVQENRFNGLAFLPLPGSPGYSLLLPTVFMDVDPSLAGFEHHGATCPGCGRYKESTVGPLVDSVEKPDDAMTVFTGTESNESIIGRRLTLFCSGQAARILRRGKISGLEIVQAL